MFPGGPVPQRRAATQMASNRTYAVFGTAVLMASLAGPVAAQEPTIEVVAQGLNNPRGVAVAADGSVYVAEAGITGDTCLEDAAVGDSEGGGICYGPTGAITHITAEGQEQVVNGLVSVGSPQDAGGVSDVAPADDGTLYFVMNLGADPAIREGMPAELQDAGWLMKVAPGGTPERVADVAAFESANDPDAGEGGEVDSNPYALAMTDGGFAVADAGGNDVLHVADDGTVSLIASIPVTMHEYSAEELAAMGGPAEGGAPDEAMPAESGAPDEAMPAEVARPTRPCRPKWRARRGHAGRPADGPRACPGRPHVGDGGSGRGPLRGTADRRTVPRGRCFCLARGRW